ncbi:Dot6p NDAI_0A01770 [Naumovozyma dairenensis CBS 421]|uniref:Uncharacterized protein n=1 Tax=Naumovozyma dairenensis (strain ATCC 10597 / BCRC 20456 / CBS 421 / NBRC 0211 / NRRL Y-12639) TaxID=1071378 RepID=G0W3E7_NAUDC|nr:hypothetical protein NDAI_0A01770 [Naumovozyma dairenensis CBS 421]CCD22335.1 hypothetical protein NDAI_0A01770 [Naumovozyma dairenensis CBS 421]
MTAPKYVGASVFSPTTTTSSNLNILNNHPHPPTQPYNHLPTQYGQNNTNTAQYVHNVMSVASLNNNISSDTNIIGIQNKSGNMENEIRSQNTTTDTDVDVDVHIDVNDDMNINDHSSSLPTSSGRKTAKKSSKENSLKNPSSWDPEDDLLLRHLKEIKKMGWKEIAQYFTNRTPNACQFRWRRLKSGNLKSNKTALMDVTEYHGTLEILNADPTISSNKNSSTKRESVSNLKSDHIIQNGITNTSTKYALSTIAVAETQVPRSTIVNDTHIVPSPPFPIKNSNAVQLDNEEMIIPNNSNAFIQPKNSSSTTATTTNTNFINSFNGSNILPVPISQQQSFNKPRANSHSFTKPSIVTQYNQCNGITTEDGEHSGFIPKVFVKSRRSSLAFLPPLSSNLATSPPVNSSINAALNITLVTSKSRKNSFASWASRRSSFSISSSTPSRRSSIIMAPTSISSTLNPKSRRESLVKKDYYLNRRTSNVNDTTTTNTTTILSPTATSNNHSNHLFANSNTFLDSNTSIASQEQRKNSRSLSISANTNHNNNNNLSQRFFASNRSPNDWTKEEDALLIENNSRNLSIMELSILLPNKSESEIQSRINNIICEGPEQQFNKTMDGYISPSHSPTKTSPRSTTNSSSNRRLPSPDNGPAGKDDEHIDPLYNKHNHIRQNDNRTKGKLTVDNNNNNNSNNNNSPNSTKNISPIPTPTLSSTTDNEDNISVDTSTTNTTATIMNSTSNKFDFGVYNLHSQSVTPRNNISITSINDNNNIVTNSNRDTISNNNNNASNSNNNNSHLPSINTIFKNMM